MLSRMDCPRVFTKPDTAPNVHSSSVSSPSLRGSQSSARSALLQQGVRLTLCVAKELKSSSPNTAIHIVGCILDLLPPCALERCITIIATPDERILQLLKFSHNPYHDSVLSQCSISHRTVQFGPSNKPLSTGSKYAHVHLAVPVTDLGPPRVERIVMPSQAVRHRLLPILLRLEVRQNTSRSMSACKSALCTSIAIALYPLSW